MKLKDILLWVVACVVLLAALFAQRHLDMRLAREEVLEAASARAIDLAELFAGELMLQRSMAGARELDEVIARPVVFAMMERPEIIACGVFGTDRLLEAQRRRPDGSLAPLSLLSDTALSDAALSGTTLSGRHEWTLALRDGDEDLGRIWLELDPKPWQSRLQKLADKSMWYLVALVQTGAVLFFLGLFAVWKMGAKKRDQD